VSYNITLERLLDDLVGDKSLDTTQPPPPICNSLCPYHLVWAAAPTAPPLLLPQVLLTFLAGNDFLPLLPSLDIYDRPSSLDLIFTAYKGLLPQLGSGITQVGREAGRLGVSPQVETK
jgi:hypothetical protein